MPTRDETLCEAEAAGRTRLDQLRHKYLRELANHTGRNVVIYYSGWLQRSPASTFDMSISDIDQAGFMACCHGTDHSRGLDVILHTPGGDLAATEAIIDYLHAMYKGDIRAIIPQLAMSSGTLIALSCREIFMGPQSSIGPVDPHIKGMPAQGVLEEFARASRDILANPSSVDIWRPVLSAYWPTLLTTCEHAASWANELLRNSLSACMFVDVDPIARAAKIERVTELLGKQSTSRIHSRHSTQGRRGRRDCGSWRSKMITGCKTWC